MTLVSSAEGGRRGWKGIRFEAAFAALGLIRCANGAPPIGLDANTKYSAEQGDDSKFRFQPQADGAVDDLVVLKEQKRIVAYQLKAGQGSLPRTKPNTDDTKGNSKSNRLPSTKSALKQAGEELRSNGGADVVILVFGSMSGGLRRFASWLADDSLPKPEEKNLDVIAQCLGFNQREADWDSLRPRLRLIEIGSVSEIGARIDDALTAVYPTPQLRISATDALKELVAIHSDEDGASLPPIDIERLRLVFHERDLPPLTRMEQYREELSALMRSVPRFMDEVRRVRGSLPEIGRPTATQNVISQLEHADIVLLGAGGTGKTELEAQVVMEMLVDGWRPIVIRRDDLGYGKPILAPIVGSGGRVDLADIVRQLIEREVPEKVLLVVDGFDEMRRISGERAGDKAAEFYRVVSVLRERIPGREHLRILLSCRLHDWSYLEGSAIGQAFKPTEIPPLTRDELLTGSDFIGPEHSNDQHTFHQFVNALPSHLVGLVLARPILLRLSYELWLGRVDDSEQSLSSQTVFADITSDLDIWQRYYNEYVCSSDSGFLAAIPRGEVQQCHRDMALAHIADGLFVLAVPREPLEQANPRAFPWLRSLEVAVCEGAPIARDVRFFHASYADFALGLALSQDTERCSLLASSPSLAMALLPIWPYVVRLWTRPEAAIRRTRQLMENSNVAFSAKQWLLKGWLERDGLDEGTAASLVTELCDISTQEHPLLVHLCELLIARIGQGTAAKSIPLWLRALALHSSALEDASLDAAMRAYNRWAECLSADQQDELAIGRPLGEEGLQRARRLASEPNLHSFYNARALATNAAKTLTHFLAVASAADDAMIAQIPMCPGDWPENADPQNAGWLASDLRDVFLKTEVLLRMNRVSPSEVCNVLCRALVTFSSEDAQATVGPPRQTEFNLIFSLSDAWQQSWRNIAKAMPALFQAGGSEYLKASVLAWMICGYVERAKYDKPYPREVEGDYWLHDSSQAWWENRQAGESHQAVVRAGFEYVAAQLWQSNVEPAQRFAELIHEPKWAGLAAQFVSLVAASIQHSDVCDEVRREASSMAAEMLLKPRALYADELRMPAALALRHMVIFLDDERATELWDRIRELRNIERIVKKAIPDQPDMEQVRRDHQRQLNEARREGDNSKRNDPLSLAPALISFLENVLTPERMFAIQEQSYTESQQIRSTAETGHVPWSDTDIKYVVCLLGEFFRNGEEHLVPNDLQEFYLEAVRELGKDQVPTFTAPVISFPSMRMGTPERATPAEPRAQFHYEADALQSARLNQTDPIPEEERERMRQRIEEARELCGVGEPAWLKYTVIYLDGLPEKEFHALSTETIDAVVTLADDVDPVDTQAVNSSLRSTVRGLAAECLALLLMHGVSEERLRPVFTKLIYDKSPTVRRSVWNRAARLRSVCSELYEPILRAFAIETDPYLLEHYSDGILRIRSQEDLEIVDQCLARMLDRLLVSSEVRFSVLEREQGGRNGLTPILVSRAIALLYHGDVPRIRERLPSLLLARAWDVVDHRIGWFLMEAVLRLVIEKGEENIDGNGLIGLLERLRERPAITLHARSKISDQAILQEIAAQTAILGTLGSALIGDLRAWELGHEFSPYASEPRESRLRGIQRFESQLRALWHELVRIWAQSDLLVRAQKLLLDAVRVLRVLAAELPSESARALQTWQLDAALPHLEATPQFALAELVEYLLLRPSEELASSVRNALAQLLDRLAAAGSPRAQAAARLLAMEQRRA